MSMFKALYSIKDRVIYPIIFNGIAVLEIRANT